MTAATGKIDYKRRLRALYAPARDPVIVNVPELAFLMIDGHGDPNTAPAFSEGIEALYMLAYAARFAVKREAGGVDYVVMPLEGLFWVSDMSTFANAERSAWDWTLMIMQPETVTPEILEEARSAANRKRSLEAIGRARLERFAEGAAGQMLHVGPYADEGPTIECLHDFIAEQGYALTGKHHEIYLSDPRRAAPEKMKTIVRNPVSRAD